MDDCKFGIYQFLYYAYVGSTRKTRGVVYCRKLTALAPGQKIDVEFDENGRPIGPHATLYTYFLGQQVRNSFVCPVKVRGWEEYTPETLDHLWTCIKVIHKYEIL